MSYHAENSRDKREALLSELMSRPRAERLWDDIYTRAFTIEYTVNHDTPEATLACRARAVANEFTEQAVMLWERERLLREQDAEQS